MKVRHCRLQRLEANDLHVLVCALGAERCDVPLANNNKGLHGWRCSTPGGKRKLQYSRNAAELQAPAIAGSQRFFSASNATGQLIQTTPWLTLAPNAQAERMMLPTFFALDTPFIKTQKGTRTSLVALVADATELEAAIADDQQQLRTRRESRRVPSGDTYAARDRAEL